MRKTLICLLIACLFTTSILPALSESSPKAAKTFVMAGYAGSDTQQDWSSNLFFKRMKEKTGISFDFRQFHDYTAWAEEKSKYFSGGDMPDVLFGADLNTQEMIDDYQAGKLIDLNPLLKQYAPNLYALLEQNPSWREAITLPGGAIAALPAINRLHAQNAMWINSTWLQRLNLAMPNDAASFQTVLEAFKTQDPNRNGSADEIPLAYLGPWDLKFLSHAFGLFANDYNMYVDENGKAQFMPSDPRYREFVAWLCNLNKSGLIDPNGFTTADSMRRPTDDKAISTYGVFFGPTPSMLLTSSQMAEYTLLPPLVYQGKQIYRSFLSPVSKGTFAITSACKDPAALLQWVDYLYSEEGGKLALLGQEGTEYAYNENGTWRWLIPQEELSTAIKGVALQDSDDYPLLNPVAFQMKYEDEVSASSIKSLNDLSQIASLPFPLLYLSKSQQKEIAPMQMEIGRFVDESLARFVLGEIPLTDETWQDYLGKLNSLGLPTFIAFWQKALDGQAR